MSSSLKQLAFVTILFTLGKVSSFASNSRAAFDTQRLSSRTLAFRLQALVFYEGEMYVDSEPDFGDDQYNTVASYGPMADESSFIGQMYDYEREKLLIKEALDSEHVAALARIAVAFSPEDRSLDLKHVEHVSVMDLDGYHIDIQAVYCVDDRASSFKIPVAFPNPCYETTQMKECVLENIDQLDMQAVAKLRQMGISPADEKEIPQDWEQLAAEAPLYLPPWWKLPVEMVDDCEYVMQLLNDFEDEVKAMAMEELSAKNMLEDLVVEKAAVIALGPLGVHIRAQARRKKLFHDDEIVVGEVTYAFAEEVTDSASLQSALLDSFVTATEFAETFSE